MKRLFVLSVLAVLFTAACAFGAVQDFGKFTLDIPEGWTANQDGSTVAVTKNDNTAAMSMTLDSAGGASLEELAAAFAKELNASDPKPTGDGDYTFMFKNQNGVDSNCLISGGEGMYILVVMTGDDVAGMTAIRDTFAFK